ncbi:hypothetical protein TEA_012823 [Camellia sinensis var. sinensis]|uniref:eRF1 domain-containing protein n=1 Tax=Camellia sinensis var. sinensis TaxID=542762 RepID=A0A4V3WJD2_CAMSN|nr:hypothetical protein TEA_012823 [Camellia sinensis var. sinensis]
MFNSKPPPHPPPPPGAILFDVVDPSASADLAVVLMQEGLAHLFLIGKRHSLREVLDAPNVMNIIKDTKAAEEDPDRACYGPKHVEVAHERMAVQTLLVTDELFRSCDIATRQKYVNLVKSVKDSGGTALIFSSMHVSGEQLAQLTGIAAILRFPLPDLEDIEM